MGLAVANARVVDNHCHGFRVQERLTLDSSGFEERLTYMGMLYDAAASDGQQVHSAERRMLSSLVGSSVFAMTARRALARFLGSAESPEAVAAARFAACSSDPAGYIRSLLADQRIEALVADEGFPDISRSDFQREVGVPVYRAWRVETWILERRGEQMGFADFEESFVTALREAAADAHTVAFKTVVAFPAGLRIGKLVREEARSAYSGWMADGWSLDGEDARVLLHFLVRRTLDVAAESDLPVHIHCGAGDPFMSHIEGMQPRDLYPLLAEYRTQPVVLIHSGYPWLEEAAYIAATLPFVYVDVSGWQPWATLDLDRGLALLLGAVPTAKVLYGSDEASEPELLWLSALLFKAALSRALDAAVLRDFLSESQAADVATGVLAGNTSTLHGLPS
jgi:predicted TIM-barrel fold metal-dependent hydrolase